MTARYPNDDEEVIIKALIEGQETRYGKMAVTKRKDYTFVGGDGHCI